MSDQCSNWAPGRERTSLRAQRSGEASRSNTEAGGYDVPVKVLWALYAAGAIVALWRTDAAWPTRLVVAALWPVGPAAFLVTVGTLLAASLIAFPVVAGVIAAAVVAAVWWFVR